MTINFFTYLPKDIIVDHIFPYIKPNETAPICASWNSMTKECENKHLLLTADKICKDFEFEQLVHLVLGSPLKQLKELTSNNVNNKNRDEIVAKTKNFRSLFKRITQKEAGTEANYKHFSEFLRREPIQNDIQLRQQHHEHQRLLFDLKTVKQLFNNHPAAKGAFLKFQEKMGVSLDEVLTFAFPMTSEQSDKMNKACYCCVLFLSGHNSETMDAFEGSNGLDFEKINSALQAIWKDAANIIITSKKEIIPASHANKELSDKEILLFTLHDARKTIPNIDKDLHVNAMQTLGAYLTVILSANLIHHLKIIND